MGRAVTGQSYGMDVLNTARDSDTLAALRSRLGRARSFESVIRSAAAEKRVTARAGGTATTIDKAGSIRVIERGVLLDAATGREFTSFNAYCWQFGDGLASLGYVRRGLDTALVVFQPLTGRFGAWASVSPHVCGRDRYYARLDLTSQGVELNWRVVGPGKQYIMSTCYRDWLC